jgi:glycosyltransferase involved in cell wall biosynthesis
MQLGKSLRQRLKLQMGVLKSKFKEWCLFDSPVAQRVIASAQFIKGRLQLACGNRLAGLLTLMRLHRAALSAGIDRCIERCLSAEIATPDPSHPDRNRLQHALDEYIAAIRPTSRLAKIFADPLNLFVHNATVLKSPVSLEKGVLLLNYSYVYAPFAKLFDLQRIAERYYIVLEPSWSGSCDENILVYGFLPSPVFVQTTEPRDIEFLQRFRGGLLPVPTAGNWWVDHHLYHPLPDVPKDSDLVMVAAWGQFKRHHAFFAALHRLRRRGRVLKTILVGYPAGMTMPEVAALARYYGVHDQIELHEWSHPRR